MIDTAARIQINRDSLKKIVKLTAESKIDKKLITDMMEHLEEYRDDLCCLEMHKLSCQHTYETKGCTCYVDDDRKRIEAVIQRAKEAVKDR